MKYRRFWIKGERDDVFRIIMKWAKASNTEYIKSDLDPRITLFTKQRPASSKILEFMFGGFTKRPSGFPFMDILLFDHGEKLIEVVFRVVEGYEGEADLVQKMLLDNYRIDKVN